MIYLKASPGASSDSLDKGDMGVEVLRRRHAGNEPGMPGMPDLLAWACGVCRQALARDSRREGGMPRIVSAGAAVCPHSSPVLPAWQLHMPGETRGPHLAPAPPQEFPPLHAGPTTNMPPTGFPPFCSYYTPQLLPLLCSVRFIPGWCHINIQPPSCRGLGERAGRSSCAAASRSAASPAPCI